MKNVVENIFLYALNGDHKKYNLNYEPRDDIKLRFNIENFEYEVQFSSGTSKTEDIKNSRQERLVQVYYDGFDNIEFWVFSDSATLIDANYNCYSNSGGLHFQKLDPVIVPADGYGYYELDEKPISSIVLYNKYKDTAEAMFKSEVPIDGKTVVDVPYGQINARFYYDGVNNRLRVSTDDPTRLYTIENFVIEYSVRTNAFGEDKHKVEVYGKDEVYNKEEVSQLFKIVEDIPTGTGMHIIPNRNNGYNVDLTKEYGCGYDDYEPISVIELGSTRPDVCVCTDYRFYKDDEKKKILAVFAFSNFSDTAVTITPKIKFLLLKK